MSGRAILIAAFLAALTGCQTLGDFNSKRYERNNDLGRAWLSDQILPGEISVAGRWNVPDWGVAVLAQTDRTVRGVLGDYAVEGVVSGRRAYLLASTGGWFSYSIVLEAPVPDILIGYYSGSVPYESNRRQDIRFNRKSTP